MTIESKKIAIMTANGVNETEVSSFQRALISNRSFPKIIGAGSRLITAWTGTEWGYNFAVDVQISEALGSDYDVLIIPGGERAMALLQATEHTKRIINAFLMAQKPLIVMNDAESLFTHFGLSYEGNDAVKIIDTTEDSAALEASINESIAFIESFGEMTLDQQAA